MDIFSAGMVPFFTARLSRREAELRHVLQSANELMHEANEAGPRGVIDFKDVAAEQSMATVDEVNAGHAERELDEVLAARRRLADHSYGNCTDCGEAIDLGRLMALAATPCCTACQAIREHGQSALRR
jgi:DnaK suppressor protein